MASLPRSHHHPYDHGNKDQHQAWLLWNPRPEHTNEHCPHSRGLGWGEESPQPLQWLPGPLPLSSTTLSSTGQIPRSTHATGTGRCTVPILETCILAQTWEHHRVKMHIVLEQAMCPWTRAAVTEKPSLWKSSQILFPSQFFKEFVDLLGGSPSPILSIKIILPSPIYYSIKTGLPG